MTISSTNRSVQYSGNGAAATFAFTFRVFEASDVMAVESNTITGIAQTMVLNTDYSVSLNADQDDYPGGSITLLAGPLATGFTMVITSDIANTQGVELTNSGGFYPEVLTTALDRLTILVQQLQAQVDLALTIPVTDPVGTLTQLSSAATRAGMFLSFDLNGNPQTNISAGSPTSGIGYGETISALNQTIFATPVYAPGANNLLVVVGGLLLTNGLDYTETNFSTITLTQPASVGEVYTFRVIH